MNNQELSKYTGVSVKTINRLMGMSGKEIIRDAEFIELLQSVDKDLLEHTLPQARAAYEKGLPNFEKDLKSRYQLENTPMSAYTLGNWVVGALQFPNYIDNIINMHNGIDSEVFASGLPDLLDMVANLPEGASEWQRALCLFSIPLMRANA